MNPSPNFDNKFTRALERVEDTVSQVDSVSSEILSAQETVTQIGNQKTELLNSLGLGDEKPQAENQPQKTAALAAKAVSVSPNIEATDLVKPGV
jgi:predicted RND superfamily exporter protein